jgi:tRNA A37 N6-isopentenylltransferase MiaA
MGAEEAAVVIALETRQFARRQRTWWRKFADITWLPAQAHPESDSALVEEALRRLDLVPSA